MQQKYLRTEKNDTQKFVSNFTSAVDFLEGTYILLLKTENIKYHDYWIPNTRTS